MSVKGLIQIEKTQEYNHVVIPSVSRGHRVKSTSYPL